MAPSDRRPDHERGVLAPWSEIRRCEDPFGLQQSPTTEIRRLAHCVQHTIEGFADLREILRRVVHCAVSAEGSHEVQVPRRDDRRYLGAIGLRELHCRRADGAGRAVDEDPAARFEAERLQIRVRIPGSLAYHGISEARTRRHDSNRPLFGYAEIFSMRTVDVRRHAEDAITRLERRDARTDRLDLSREVHAEDRALRPEEPREEPDEKRVGSEHAAIGPADRRRMNSDQDFVRFRFRFRHLSDLQDVWRSPACVDNCFHYRGLRHSLNQVRDSLRSLPISVTNQN